MIEPTAGKFQTGGNIFRFEVRQLFKNLLLRKTSGQQIQHVDDSNAHPTDTGTSTTLLRVHRDTFDKFGHGDASWMGEAHESSDRMERVY